MAELSLNRQRAAAGRTPLVLGTLGHAVNDAYTAFLPVYLPLFHVRLGLDGATLAALVATFALSASLPGPLLGRLSDKFGEETVTAVSVLFSAVLLSFAVVAPSVPMLFALVAVAGLGSAAIHPAGSMLVRRGSRRPELAVALFAAGGMFGYAAGPAFLAQARDVAGQALPLLLALPGVLAAAMILALAPRGADLPKLEAVDISRFDLRLIFGPIGLITLAAAFASLPFTSVLNGLPLYFMARHGVGETDPVISATLSTFSFAAAVGGIGIGFLASRVARHWLLATVLTGSVPALLALLWFGPETTSFFVMLGVAGALSYAAMPILVVSAQDLAPRSGAAASGMVFGIGSAIAGLLYLGIGALQARLGVGTALSLAFVAPLISAVISLIVLRRVSSVVWVSNPETLCACVAAGTIGIVQCMPSCNLTCNGETENV